jgi:hypothetical protein
LYDIFCPVRQEVAWKTRWSCDRRAIAVPLTSCRLVDNMRGMSTKSISHSLPLEFARKVKAETDRRNLSLRKLFGELWGICENQASKAKP